MDAFWGFFILAKLCFNVMPKMFDWIKVRGLGRPLHDIKIMIIEPGLGLLAGVLRVIVLLENDVARGFVVIMEGSLELILQNLAIKVCIHLTINLACISSAFPCHTAPHHHGTTTKL